MHRVKCCSHHTSEARTGIKCGFVLTESSLGSRFKCTLCKTEKTNIFKNKNCL